MDDIINIKLKKNIFLEFNFKKNLIPENFKIQFHEKKFGFICVL